MALHVDDVTVDADTVVRLLCRDRPDLAGLPIQLIGGGTDNTMYRVGTDHVVRLPRHPGSTDALATELRWLPRLAPHLPCRVPIPEHAGARRRSSRCHGRSTGGSTAGIWRRAR